MYLKDMQSLLFACSKCFSRCAFEELSRGQQICGNCRSIFKCAYCRSEFRSATKSEICPSCDQNLNIYGKPGECEYCKIIAAFGSSKCMRCETYEIRYGPPTKCHQCKLKSAFKKRGENVDEKNFCWLCSCSLKRTILKAKAGLIPKRMRRDSSSESDFSHSSVEMGGGRSAPATSVRSVGSPRSVSSGRTNGSGFLGSDTTATPSLMNIEPNFAEHVGVVTNLKDRIAVLEKRLQQKDKEMMEKDKIITELKANNFENENKMRNKFKESERLHQIKLENLNTKITSLLKEVAILRKGRKSIGHDAKDRKKKKPGNGFNEMGMKST